MHLDSSHIERKEKMGLRMKTIVILMARLTFFGFVGNVFAQMPEPRAHLLQTTFEQLHHEQYDSALATCAELRRLQPDDPTGDVMAATVYQTMMRLYRVRLFEAELDSFSRRAGKLAQKHAHKTGTAEAWFMLGSAKGNLALQRFHRGEWAAALQDFVLTLHAMKEAMKRDKNFMDPGLALALYEYWKSKKLGMGIGLFSGGRKEAFRLLEKVESEAHYVRLDASFSLQDLYMHEGEYARALAINEGLYLTFPEHPSVLYHRGVLLEKVQRGEEALQVWEKLETRIRAFRKPSYAFLAECELRRVRILEKAKAGEPKIAAALEAAALHMRQHDPALEMPGPFENFKQLEEVIQELSGKYALASSKEGKH